MKKGNKFTSIDSVSLVPLLQKLDAALAEKSQKAKIVVLGGLAIIAQGFRERATLDIDIAQNRDAAIFIKICNQFAIPVDVITVSSTVDLHHAPTKNIFSGKCLTLEAITAPDLIKLKLERFYKQDPDDIYAMIQKIRMTYDGFKKLFIDMLPDFIGNPRGLILSAQLVVERMFPEKIEDFKKTVSNRP
ncbi:MAG: DUF6036 family nucleotidyltransferase [Deltaproteobacteria bacterium]|nr:DUF6036 family nucleotidyltransferase [Deltaproteobacteria bacterium]